MRQDRHQATLLDGVSSSNGWPNRSAEPLMASGPSLVTPSGRFDVAQQQVSHSEDDKVECRAVGLQEIQVGGKVNNGVVHNRGFLLHLDLHTNTNNFAPNEYRGVVNSSGLAVYKGSTQEIKVQRKVNTESKLRV